MIAGTPRAFAASRWPVSHARCAAVIWPVPVCGFAESRAMIA
jgi:hypothetical protein